LTDIVVGWFIFPGWEECDEQRPRKSFAMTLVKVDILGFFFCEATSIEQKREEVDQFTKFGVDEKRVGWHW